MLLTSCATISREIQQSANVTNNPYPAAVSNNPELKKSLFISLKHYKSVQTRPNQRADIAIALAASGGGYRAANLTLGVLMGLEQIRSPHLKGNLLQEVDYFSTVSGGGFGVGYYMTELHNYQARFGQTGSFLLGNQVNKMLNQQGANALSVDLTEHLFFGKGRGFDLERKLNEAILNTSHGGLQLGDIFVPAQSKESVHLPYWAVNTTVFQNAAIFPFTPDILSRYRVTGYFHNGQLHEIDQDFQALDYGDTVPVSVGMTASASVPFATPATTLVTKGCNGGCYLQLLDGGLSDNIGVYTALSLLLQDKSKTKVLIIVDAYKGDAEPYSQQMTPPTALPMLWRMASIGTDSNREHIKPNVRFVTRDLLCENKANNVIVIYLDLGRYPKAKKIGTQLTISAESQKMLIRTGQQLVLQDESLKRFISELNKGHLKIGHCQR